MSLKNLVIMAIIPLVAFSADRAWGEFTATPSFQGFTGLLDTPNACVTQEETMDLGYSNQVEKHRRNSHDHADNYMVSFGLLPGFEFGARLTDEDKANGMMDLSANAKFQFPLPRSFNGYPLPTFAIGAQDVGGGATHLETQYAVLSQEYKLIRMSIGYGNGKDRMDGVFGGVELRVFDWCHLVGEYDTLETNLGIKFMAPLDFIYLPLKLGMSAKTSLDHEAGNFDLSFLMQIPLGGAQKPMSEASHSWLQKTLPASTATGSPDLPPKSRKMPAADSQSRQKSEPSLNQELLTVEQVLSDLKKALEKEGFENLEVGIKEKSILYIAYENNRYNHNELDGLAVVLAMAAAGAPTDLTSMAILSKEMNIPMFEVQSSLNAYRGFIRDKGNISDENADFFLSQARILSPTPLTLTHIVKGHNNSSRFKTRLFLYPGLQTMLGTEVGAFDYLLSLKLETQTNVIKGGAISARFDIPLAWSDDFKNRKGDAELDRFMYHQGFKITNSIMNLASAGMYNPDNIGILNETAWSPVTSNHRIKLTLGYFEDDLLDKERKIWLGTYGYFYDDLNLILEATYGQYWHQDRGVNLQMKRFFGDNTLGIFYRHVGTGDGERAAGVSFSIPLTPRLDMRPGLIQLRGSDQWTYSHMTTIAGSGQRNPLNTNLTVIPETGHTLDRIYYNRNRFHKSYIHEHLK